MIQVTDANGNLKVNQIDPQLIIPPIPFFYPEGESDPHIGRPSPSQISMLGDYSTGPWTPTDGSGAGLVFSTSQGQFVKIGKFVQLSLFVVYPATASGASAIISGLPFPITPQQPGGGLQSPYPIIAGTPMFFYAREGTSRIELYLGSGAAVTNLSLSTVAVYITGAYIAAS